MTTYNALKWDNCRVRLGDLREWEHNPATIGKAEAERLLASLDEFGQVQALAIDPDNVIVDGHQRKAVWSMAERYGVDFIADCRRASRALTEKERQKLAVFLRSGAVGHYDWDELANWGNPDELIDWGLDKSLADSWVAGARWVNDMIDSTKPEADAEPQIDRAAELLEKWQVKTGDLWRIGEHRLLCGDCTVSADVERLMQGERCGACVTDPPYGVLDEEWDRPFSQNDLDMIFSVTDGLIACFNAAKTEIILNMLSLSPMPDRMGVWRYSQIMPRPGMIWSWQPVFYWNCGNVKEWDSLDWYQGNSDKTGTHPTQKPIEFFEKIIKGVDAVIIFDPFLGSGTTLVACQNLGRRGRGIEISPAYCAVTLERMVQAFPGIEIERMS